jgi:hypothetical protein
LKARGAGAWSLRAVLVLFLTSVASQLVLPFLHALEVDARECEERSCKGHPRSHVEADLGPSHHDSNTCRVCQTIYSAGPTESPTGGQVTVKAALIDAAVLDSSISLVRDPLPLSSSPRSPPASF